MRVVTPTVASSDKDSPSRSEEKLGSSMWNHEDPFHFLGVARELRTGRSLFSCCFFLAREKCYLINSIEREFDLEIFYLENKMKKMCYSYFHHQGDVPSS